MTFYNFSIAFSKIYYILYKDFINNHIYFQVLNYIKFLVITQFSNTSNKFLSLDHIINPYI